MVNENKFPDNFGRYGDYGGRFVPETLMPAIHQLEKEYLLSQSDENFQMELKELLNTFATKTHIPCRVP